VLKINAQVQRGIPVAKAKPPAPAVKPASKRAPARGSTPGAGKKAATPRSASSKARPAAAPVVRAERKLVRGRFTLPAMDFERIAATKARARDLGRPARKNELLRVALALLTALPDESLVIALDQLEPVGKKARRKRARSDLDNRDD
jgi:hypothetical protein